MNWFNKIKLSQGKIIFIARGPSGSGKSTMVKELAKKYNAPVLSTDDYFMKDGIYNFDVKQIAKAHETNQNRYLQKINDGESFIIVDNTNTTFAEMKFYVKNGINNGYKIEFVEPNWSDELKNNDGTWNADFLKKLQKNKDRNAANKTLPDFVVDRMVSRYQYNPSVDKVLNS